MNKDLYTILKGLKNIRPDNNYSKQSLQLILSSPQISANNNNGRLTIADILNWFDIKHLTMSAGAIAAFIFVILWAVSYLPGNKNSLIVKANEINASIQVKLDEIEYHLNSQIIDSSTADNIQNLLKKTTDELIKAQNELSLNPERLKEIIEKIKKAEQDMIEINQLFQNQNYK